MILIIQSITQVDRQVNYAESADSTCSIRTQTQKQATTFTILLGVYRTM